VVTTTVEAIDHERRTITIKTPDGKAVTLRASKKVRNFQEIKKGDVVSAEYLEAVAVIVRKPDGKSNPGYLKEVTVAPPGRESAALPVNMVESLGTAEAIDYGLRTVTFKGPDEVIQTYKVDTRVKKLKEILRGDKVYVKVTEPLAVRIRPVEK
jgi:translation initiation factor IF-1